MKKIVLPAILDYLKFNCRIKKYTAKDFIFHFNERFSLSIDTARFSRWVNGSKHDPMRKEYLDYLISFILETIKNENFDACFLANEIKKRALDAGMADCVQECRPYYDRTDYTGFIKNLILKETTFFHTMIDNNPGNPPVVPDRKTKFIVLIVVCGLVLTAIVLFILNTLPANEKKINWNIKGGMVLINAKDIVLTGQDNVKATISADFSSAAFNCLFTLMFEQGFADSSIGLETWDPDAGFTPIRIRYGLLQPNVASI